MHIIIIIIILSSIHASCGAAKYAKVPGYKTDSGQSDISHDPSPAPVSSKPIEEYASYAATSQDVPACTSTNQNQLIYVNDVAMFEVCETGSWVNVKIQGKDGKNGVDAPDPINEKYLWKDPVTATLWMLPGASMPYVKNATCSGVYREPSQAEAALAAQRGLKLAAITLSAPLIIWTNEQSFAGQYTYDMSHNPMQPLDQLRTALGGAYCIHN